MVEVADPVIIIEGALDRSLHFLVSLIMKITLNSGAFKFGMEPQ